MCAANMKISMTFNYGIISETFQGMCNQIKTMHTNAREYMAKQMYIYHK